MFPTNSSQALSDSYTAKQIFDSGFSPTFPLSKTTMSFNVLRAPVRRAAVLAKPFPKAQPFRGSFRHNSSTSTPPPKSNFPLIAGLGAVVLAAGGYYVYTSDSDSAKGAKSALKSGAQVGKAYANFTPSQEDYQKVRSRFPAKRPLSNVISTAGLQQDCRASG